jgi:hypothetical protein
MKFGDFRQLKRPPGAKRLTLEARPGPGSCSGDNERELNAPVSLQLPTQCSLFVVPCAIQCGTAALDAWTR